MIEVIKICATRYLCVVAVLYLWLFVETVEMLANQDSKAPEARQRYREERLLIAKILVLLPILPIWFFFRLFWAPAPRSS